MAGKIKIIEIDAVRAGVPEDAVEKTNKGKVITFPAPIKNVNKYWLHDTRKANKAATTIPGAIAGSVIKKNVFVLFAPSVLAWCSKSGL